MSKSIPSYQETSPWNKFKTISTIDIQQNGLYFYFDTPNEEATITNYAESIAGNFQVPDYVVYEGVDYDVVAIDDNAFEDCTEMTSVIIPKSVTSIGQSPFKGCSGLTSIVVNSRNKVYDSRNDCNAIIETATGKLIQGCNNTIIPDDITSIGSCAFYGCSGLASVTIPNSVTEIGEEAFNGCSALTSVTINSNAIVSANRTESDNINHIFGSQVTEYVVGNSVTAIGENAFRGNTNLTTVSIGKNIGSIGDNAFYDCSNLTTFTCHAVDIPTANSTVFEGIDLTTATLYVPASALEDYEETKPWRRFGTILPINDNIVPTAIDTIGVEDKDNDKQYYDLNGRRMTSSQPGLRIVRDRNGKTRKVIIEN